MADDDTTNTDTPDAPATDAKAPEDALGDAGKKALDRMKAERDAARREAKANAEAAKRLREIEEENKSEVEKAADALAAAQRERDEARAGLLRYRIAAEHGIPAEDAELFLTATDEDTLIRQAERLAARAKERADAAAAAEAEASRRGNFVPREGHGNNQTDADTAALSVLGFG